uniref:Uncharacterized protein n=1 Tax=Anguilla anguilla TaxID=7936 RepID=A0A0E9X5G3_ANGAN
MFPELQEVNEYINITLNCRVINGYIFMLPLQVPGPCLKTTVCFVHFPFCDGMNLISSPMSLPSKCEALYTGSILL